MQLRPIRNRSARPAWLRGVRVLALAVLSTGSLLAGSATQSLQRVSVLDYGVVPDDGRNDLPALRAMLDQLRTKPGLTIVFPRGRYDLRDEEAVALMNQVMRGEFGINPEAEMFRPYRPYVRGLDLHGFRDLTVEASGAELICDGWMEPVSIDQAERLTLIGLTIDYKRPPHSIGKVIAVGDGHFDVQFGSAYPVNEGIPTPRVGFWDPLANRMLGNFAYPKRSDLIAPQTLRIYSQSPEGALHSTAFMGHTFHFRPAILIQESSSVELRHVTIHSQPGMGIVGHRSSDLRFLNLRVVPRAGSVMSTNTDATHFTSCSGTIEFEDCQFEGQGDDSANIHNYYYTIYPVGRPASYRLKVEAPTGTHAQVLDHPEAGDRLELVNRSTLGVVRELTVESVRNNPSEWWSEVVLDQSLPEELGDYLLINSTRLPKVVIRGCQVRSHRARAFLIKTRQVLIENSTIENTTGTAIHVGAEGDWAEGPGSTDVVIRYNRILYCGYGEGTQNGSAGIAINVKSAGEPDLGVHRRITIEGNQIIGRGARYGIFASGVTDLFIRDNEYSGVEEPVGTDRTRNVERSDLSQNSEPAPGSDTRLP